jgi:hypothetical protein
VNVALAVLSATLALASVLFAVMVPILALLANRSLVLQDRHLSTTPVVGTILGSLAVVLAPIGTLHDRLAWSWVPFAVEVGVFGLCFAYWNLSGLGRELERQRHSRRR